LTPNRRWTLADFDYDLPPELIAQRPTARRGESRLLVVRRPHPRAVGRATRAAAPTATLTDLQFRDLASLIPPGDLVVLNTTRVRHARFLGTRPSGAPAEVLLVRPQGDGTWTALGTPGKALRPGKRIRLGADVFIETVSVLPDGMRVVRFVGCTAEEAMATFGKLPLPPYITRPADEHDEDRYQTVYADREGSVAAPTAGLHFTPALLDTLRRNGVLLATLDLEVGPGTFRPIETEDPAAHRMHAERYEIPEDLATAVDQVRERKGHLWAVGTTVVRALESAASPDGRLHSGAAETSLFIMPGYRFRVVDRLITNFHLPRSTLLMLVAAFAGLDLIRTAYRHAVEQRYRFYSYGDAMAIL
jgi:S-adenosylmethionine:tRNA ribosyltransferase-isomerase